MDELRNVASLVKEKTETENFLDDCVSGVEWSEGEFGICVKTASYAGFEFDTYRMEGEA